MKSMRAFFGCDKQAAENMIAHYEVAKSVKLNVAVHDESDDNETIVSGLKADVMALIGWFASSGDNRLTECWEYEV